mmetsp:Transcript_9500/g.21100  ORF Transcript_9500/g.21100 Transcript_9500/m.21100 type:complete len:348 (-) Transcript_9500:113-1156(-)|eukprot:CAMPEP_0170611190 /NCGR_PEP_ID=MMETSP0224-20130122/23059_1 /TAXON_ID=285029 /ORGANISM="Togula jolla, Strain CCCM 725" /LENGTH=347 /DNA_ID=CAMNT_0010936613 /DNA_START=57 /DNA_END=1100 /DNA_ORIENTATION=-
MTWFHEVFGFAETTGSARAFEETKKQLQLDGSTLTSKATGRAFQAGVFETPSLKQLRQRVDLNSAKSTLPGPLRVQEILGDVSEMHTALENHSALFQAASQFNCLEFVSQNITPERGVTCYAHDRTQGPACATACAPGTVVRNYFALDGVGQSAKKQVENLEDVEELLENKKNQFFHVVGGYTMARPESLARLTRTLQSDPAMGEQIREHLRIGLQWDTQVTGSKFGAKLYRGPEQLVTQAYCSACSVSYSSAGAKSWEAFATLILEASYEATLYAAVENALRHGGERGSRRVFLTLLGNGVFGNKTSWVISAMQRAFRKFQGLGMEVYIVSFGQSTPGLEGLFGDW